MIWEIILHAKFEEWFFGEEPEVQDSIAMVLDILEEQGASLGRPYVDTIDLLQISSLKLSEPIQSCITQQLSYTVAHNVAADCGNVAPKF